MVKVLVKTLPHFTGLSLPRYETAGAAGMDVVAALNEGERVEVWPGQRVLIPTGLKVAVPEGYEIQVRGRSGLALREGITIANGIGTIDSDYRGELGIILLNTRTAHESSEPFIVKRGDRIAQIVVAPVVQCEWETANVLPSTDRGENGFGSTKGYGNAEASE